jgi:hypothetical protein
MHPAISYGLATARIVDLRRGAQRDALARAATHEPSSAPQPGRNRIPVSLRRVGRRRRFGVQLWTLLHAQALFHGPATAAGNTSFIEDDYRRFAARRETPVDRRLPDARASRGVRTRNGSRLAADGQARRRSGRHRAAATGARAEITTSIYR